MSDRTITLPTEAWATVMAVLDKVIQEQGLPKNNVEIRRDLELFYAVFGLQPPMQLRQ